MNIVTLLNYILYSPVLKLLEKLTHLFNINIEIVAMFEITERGVPMYPIICRDNLTPVVVAMGFGLSKIAK